MGSSNHGDDMLSEVACMERARHSTRLLCVVCVVCVCVVCVYMCVYMHVCGMCGVCIYVCVYACV